jgi:hypothetical protein
MEIGRVGYELTRLAVLFEVIEEGGRFVCGISLDQLDPNGVGHISGEEGLEFFNQNIDQIRERAAAVVSDAKDAGIQHIPGQLNEPLLITLII